MDEEALRAVLTRIAADPGPPARIDIDAARRHGRLLARRSAWGLARGGRVRRLRAAEAPRCRVLGLDDPLR